MLRLSMILVFLQVGCTDVQRGTVAATRAPCQGEGVFMCLRLEADGETTIVHGGIDGFTHRWGTETEIEFHSETIADPPADASSQRLVLDRVLDENAAPTTAFDLAFFEVAPGNSTWFRGTTSPLDMLGTAVECEAGVCADLLAGGNSAFTVSMELTADPQRLRALAIQ